jgi:hypothetical protein
LPAIGSQEAVENFPALRIERLTVANQEVNAMAVGDQQRRRRQGACAW